MTLKSNIKFFGSSFLAGFCISIGALLYLKIGGVLGAALFSVGLICVISQQLKLFTGKSWMVFGTDYIEYLLLFYILIGNIIGCMSGALLFGSSVNVAASQIISSRLSAGPMQCGFLAVPCGFLMTAAVRSKEHQLWPFIAMMCVIAFIIGGFPHCIADVFYYTLNSEINWQVVLTYILCVIGNYIGCNLYRIAGNT